MKTYKNLFKKLISYENLSLAIDKASIRKRKRKDVQRVLNNKPYYIKELQRLLITKEYHNVKHRPITIIDGCSKKKRIIIKPNFCYEQILQHAVIQVLEPIIMKGMYKYSCGSIPRRGKTYGKRYIKNFIRTHSKNCKYCYKIDIHHFFPSINHDILKKIIPFKN